MGAARNNRKISVGDCLPELLGLCPRVGSVTISPQNERSRCNGFKASGKDARCPCSVKNQLFNPLRSDNNHLLYNHAVHRMANQMKLVNIQIC